MSSISTQLSQIASSSSTKDKTLLYRQLLESILASNPVSTNAALHQAVTEFISHVIQESVGLVVSRSVLSNFILLVAEWGGKAGMDQDGLKRIWEIALETAGTRAVAFEDQVCGVVSMLFMGDDCAECRMNDVSLERHHPKWQISGIREKLAEIYESEESWTEAARVLQVIPLDSGHRVVSDEYKLGIYLKIGRLFLEDDDAVSAEACLNRAAIILSSIPNTSSNQNVRVAQLQLKASQAKVLDFQRRFLQAAQRYFELSYAPEMAYTPCSFNFGRSRTRSSL